MADSLWSPGGEWRVFLQGDGNLVLEHMPSGKKWGLVDKILPWPLEVPVDPPVDPPASWVPTRETGLGVAYYTGITDPDCNLAEWANRTRDVGSRHTRFWLFDAWANGRLEGAAPGGVAGSMYRGFQPWQWTPSGFDLSRPSMDYWSRVDLAVNEFHRTGQHVVLSILERYTWTEEKQGKLWVPTRDLQPTRNNIQGVRWGDPDDDFWFIQKLPDETLEQFCRVLLAAIGSRWDGVTLEVGNEMKERGLHYRVRDMLRRLGWLGRIGVSRNRDTPSMYDAMGIGREFDRLSIHGKEDESYIYEVFGGEHLFQTFHDADASGTIDPTRFVLSSDGVGNNNAPPYFDEDALVRVAEYGYSRGYAFEHQAREIKNGRFKLGRLDLGDLNTTLCRRLNPPT